MPVDTPASLGAAAVEAAERKYNLRARTDRRGFWDATHRNGKKAQIKSARHSRGNGQSGVFRVWREHLRNLAQLRGSVVLVVVNPQNPQRPVLKVEKTSPRRLLRVGDFRATGQQAMAGKHEARIPWPEVVDL